MLCFFFLLKQCFNNNKKKPCLVFQKPRLLFQKIIVGNHPKTPGVTFSRTQKRPFCISSFY